MSLLFDDVFNKVSIYETLFFNIKAVLEYPTLIELESKNPELFKSWKQISKNKYNEDVDTNSSQGIYEQFAPNYPEFTKIVTITYATLNFENNALKRTLKKIVNDNEINVISDFMEILHHLSTDGAQSTPAYFPNLCGFNIIGYEIPLLIKRFILHRDKFENKQLPLILKRTLNIKPWESGLIDVQNVWKFNGYDSNNLTLISNFLGLKKTVDLLSAEILSKEYWTLYKESPEKAIELVGLQSATQTNLVVQLINELRHL